MMAVRITLTQLVDSVGIGILGLNRSCVGASTSSSQQQPVCVGLRYLRSLVESSGQNESYQQCQQGSPLAGSRSWVPGRIDSPHAAPIAATGPIWPSLLVRGYKSNKRSLKPLNTAASWQAVQPLIAEQRQRNELLRDGPPPLRPRLRPRLGPIVDTCLPPIPTVALPTEYKRVGIITGHYQLKPERMFAVVQLAGTQFKVTTDDIIFVNQLPGVEVNDVLALERVMLLGSRAQTIVGRPYVPGGLVLAAVEEHFRDGKIHVFKKRRRKRYRKYQGPRPNMTTLRILQVRGIDPAPGDELAMLPELPIQPLDPRYEQLLRTGEGDEEEEKEEEQRHLVGAVPEAR